MIHVLPNWGMHFDLNLYMLTHLFQKKSPYLSLFQFNKSTDDIRDHTEVTVKKSKNK
jgi:hypothetical protein